MDKQIEKIGSYFGGVNVAELPDEHNNLTTFKVLTLNIPYGWETFSEQNDKYEITPHIPQDNPHKCELYGVNNISFSDLFEFAIKLIKHNNDKSEKTKLYELKVSELKEIFMKNDINILRGLEIKVGKKKPNKSQANSDQINHE
jgi:hypothetical protein